MNTCKRLLKPLIRSLLFILIAAGLPKTSLAAATPAFTATAAGSTYNLTLTASLSVADADAGHSGNIYLVANVGSAWYVHNGTTWVAWSSGPLPAYAAGTLADRSIEALRNVDMSALGGTTIYLGYGLTENDMLANGKFGLIYTVPATAVDSIAFVSLRDGWNNIWIMNADGTNPRRLTLSQVSYSEDYPSSSPDGSKLVFTRYSKGIVVLDASGERIIRSDNLNPMFTTWSYDNKVYFTRLNQTTDNAKEYLYTMNADGSGETQISPIYNDTSTAGDRHPSLSPDGSALLFSTNRTKNGGTIAKLMLASGAMSYLTYSGNLLGETVISPAEQPTWSPDGTKIAFAAYPGYPDFSAKEQIYVMNADGSGKTKLTQETAANCSHPAWSPDGSRIAFQKDYPGFSNTTEIWIMNADGSGAKALTDRNVTHSDSMPVFLKKPL